jgi:hypothetical protein
MDAGAPLPPSDSRFHPDRWVRDQHGNVGYLGAQGHRGTPSPGGSSLGGATPDGTIVRFREYTDLDKLLG